MHKNHLPPEDSLNVCKKAHQTWCWTSSTLLCFIPFRSFSKFELEANAIDAIEPFLFEWPSNDAHRNKGHQFQSLIRWLIIYYLIIIDDSIDHAFLSILRKMKNWLDFFFLCINEFILYSKWKLSILLNYIELCKIHKNNNWSLRMMYICVQANKYEHFRIELEAWIGWKNSDANDYENWKFIQLE